MENKYTSVFILSLKIGLHGVLIYLSSLERGCNFSNLTEEEREALWNLRKYTDDIVMKEADKGLAVKFASFQRSPESDKEGLLQFFHRLTSFFLFACK